MRTLDKSVVLDILDERIAKLTRLKQYVESHHVICFNPHQFTRHAIDSKERLRCIRAGFRAQYPTYTEVRLNKSGSAPTTVDGIWIIRPKKR